MDESLAGCAPAVSLLVQGQGLADSRISISVQYSVYPPSELHPKSSLVLKPKGRYLLKLHGNSSIGIAIIEIQSQWVLNSP